MCFILYAQFTFGRYCSTCFRVLTSLLVVPWYQHLPTSYIVAKVSIYLTIARRSVLEYCALEYCQYTVLRTIHDYTDCSTQYTAQCAVLSAVSVYVYVYYCYCY